MNLYEAIDEQEAVATAYAGFVERLLDKGWEKYGKPKEHFLAYPNCAFGASRYFLKNDQLHLVSTSLNIRSSYGLTDIINVSEYNLTKKELVASVTTEVSYLDQEVVSSFTAKYTDVKAVSICVMDDEENLSFFMGLTGDGRARFERRSDEDRLRPAHETQSLVAIVDCQYEITELKE